MFLSYFISVFQFWNDILNVLSCKVIHYAFTPEWKGLFLCIFYFIFFSWKSSNQISIPTYPYRVMGELLLICCNGCCSHWTRVGIHPRQLTSQSQGKTQSCMRTHTLLPNSNLEYSVDLTIMFFDCRRRM